MSMVNAWYALEDAAVKFGVERAMILRWVEDGVVRSEEPERGVIRVNVDDLELVVQDMTRI